MILGDLCALLDCADLPAAGVREHPEREAVVSARNAVTVAVRDDEFLADCMAYELDLLQQPVPAFGLVPFYTMPTSGVRFAFGYWPPGRKADPHEHTAWTITAVCRNQLSVHTFDREKSYRQRELIPKSVFDAPAGRVGFIYEPCIHAPRNPTNRWSLSLHVTSPRDGEAIDQDLCLPPLDHVRSRPPVNYGDPYTWVEFARLQQIRVDQIAGFLAETQIAAAEGLLARCRRLGSADTNGDNIDDLSRDNPPTATTLTLTHADLILSCREFDGCVALGVETSTGWREQVRMARLARDAVAFCASRPTFDIHELPGPLTGEERWAIASALVRSGTFRMIAR